MSGSLSLLEHTKYTILSEDDLKLLRGLQDSLEVENCEFLGFDPREKTKPQLFEELGGNTVQTGCYVGLLSYQGTTISIHSRFDGEQHLFLRYLMEKVWDIPVLLTPEGQVGSEQDLYILWLICQMAVQLQTAWKKGTFRTYQSFDHYDSRVRGQLDIPRYIRLSMGLNDGRMAYRTREYSPDNPYNRLFLCAVNAAERKYRPLMRRLFQQMPEYKAAVQFLRQQLPNWDQDQPRVLMKRTKKKITHPVYRRYEDVRLTARAILRWTGRESLATDKAVGILLNMDKLWEKFLAKTLFQETQEICQQRSFDSLGYPTHNPDKPIEYLTTVCPDFYWEDRDGGVVLDAKNRPVWGKFLKWSQKMKMNAELRQKMDEGSKDKLDKDDWRNIRENRYQVFSYMLALNCAHGGVIFPVKRSEVDKDFLRPVDFQAFESVENKKFWLIPFVIPNDVDTYEEFQGLVSRQAEKINPIKEGDFNG